MLLEVPRLEELDDTDDTLDKGTPLQPGATARPEPQPPAKPTPAGRTATTASTPIPEGPPPPAPRTPRNQKCPCGSGLKFKKCCLNRRVCANAA
ncbi:MAG: SEC-C domain-containing protein [Bryobacterales bacterium]|nr:SEC-C domain-containing protein [Bryobacterales bacterium]